MSVVDLSVDVGLQPLDPATHLPLMEMTYSNSVLEQKFAKAGALDFFTPEVDNSWKNDLSIHQSLRIRFKGYRNPFNHVAVSAVTYTESKGDSQPPTIDSQCDPGCISSENKWNYVDVRFKNKFRIGVSWCVEEEALLYQDGESRFSESVEDSKVVIATVGWSELINQAVTAPATTLIPNFATFSPTHYYDGGTTDRLTVLTKVIQYMQRVYGQRWQNEFAILGDPQLELDLLAGTSTLHNYDNTGQPSPWAHTDTFVAGGFRAMTALPRGLWGKPIMIAPDVVDYYPTDGPLAGQNLNPFSNASGSKYYVVIVSKRAFFHGAAPMMNKRHFPATCDNKNDAIQQTWITFYKLLFPAEVFVIAFTR